MSKENYDDIDDILEARKIAMKMVKESDCTLANELLALEFLVSPFYLGIDEDNDDSDLAVFP
jgi:hypothetical protein